MLLIFLNNCDFVLVLLTISLFCQSTTNSLQKINKLAKLLIKGTIHARNKRR
jgi:hypothetical protein